MYVPLVFVRRMRGIDAEAVGAFSSAAVENTDEFSGESLFAVVSSTEIVRISLSPAIAVCPNTAKALSSNSEIFLVIGGPPPVPTMLAISERFLVFSWYSQFFKFWGKKKIKTKF